MRALTHLRAAHSCHSSPSFARLERPSPLTTLRPTARLTSASPRLSRVTWTSPPAWSRTSPAPAPSTATPSAATRPQQTRLSWRAAKRWPSWRGATPTSCSWWRTTAARGAAATQASHRCMRAAQGSLLVARSRSRFLMWLLPLACCLLETVALNVSTTATACRPITDGPEACS